MNGWLRFPARTYHRFAAAGADLPRRSPASRAGGILALVTLAWVAVAPHAAAQSAGLEIEGRYEVLQPPQQTETGDQNRGRRGLLHTAARTATRFLPMIRGVRAGQARVRRDPAPAGRSSARAGSAHARAFYTADAPRRRRPGRTRPLFEEIHERRNPTDHKEALAAFFERQGVDRGKIRIRPGIRSRSSRWSGKSILMQQRYGITWHAFGGRQRQVPGYRPARRAAYDRRDPGGDGARGERSARRSRAPPTDLAGHSGAAARGSGIASSRTARRGAAGTRCRARLAGTPHSCSDRPYGFPPSRE